MSILNGVIVTPNALVETEERLFPASRHRSKRIRKKLIKRFGGEFRMKPACFKTPQGLIIHPTLYAELKAQVADMEQRFDPFADVRAGRSLFSPCVNWFGGNGW